MGIYSDVALATTPECLEFIKEFVKEKDPENNVFKWSHTEDVQYGTALVMWYSVRWYWEHVRFFERALDAADEKGYPWEYVQVCTEAEYASKQTSAVDPYDELSLHIEWDYEINTYV